MDFSNLKGIVSGFVGNVSQKASGFAGNAADKAKSAGRIAKLTLELNGEKESLKKSFATIGQTYYENKGSDQPCELLAQLCEEADSISERINAIEAELLELKADFGPKEADVEVSFEEVVEEAENAAEEAVEEIKTVNDIVNYIEKNTEE